MIPLYEIGVDNKLQLIPHTSLGTRREQNSDIPSD